MSGMSKTREPPWIFRTYAGHSSAVASNALYRRNLAKGQTLKTKIAVDRNPAYAGPITLTFQNLPKGVTAAAAMIAAGQNEVEVELTAAADAAAGTAAGSAAVADRPLLIPGQLEARRRDVLGDVRK